MITPAYLRYGLLKQVEAGWGVGVPFFSLQRTQVIIRCLCNVIPFGTWGIRLCKWLSVWCVHCSAREGREWLVT